MNSMIIIYEKYYQTHSGVIRNYVIRYNDEQMCQIGF